MDVSVTQIADRPTQLICILLLHKKADNNNGGKLLEYDDVNICSVNRLTLFIAHYYICLNFKVFIRKRNKNSFPRILQRIGTQEMLSMKADARLWEIWLSLWESWGGGICMCSFLAKVGASPAYKK